MSCADAAALNKAGPLLEGTRVRTRWLQPPTTGGGSSSDEVFSLLGCQGLHLVEAGTGGPSKMALAPMH